MKRKIKVVYPVQAKRRFQDKIFSSYKEVALNLSIGEEVTVAVADVMKDDMEVLAGYGEIKRDSEDSYSYPKRLEPMY